MIQEQIISKILNSQDFSFIINNNIDEKYFEDCKNEFNFLVNHYKTYSKVPDKETFKSIFPNFKILDSQEPDSYLLQELNRDFKARSLTKVFNKVKYYIDNDKIDDAYNLAKQFSNTDETCGFHCVDIIKDTSRYDDYIERMNNFDRHFVKTGFKELDDIIGGWDREEDLVAIIARTNVGKSQIAIKTALTAAQQGLNVGFYSGEMSENKVGYRIDTYLSHISNSCLSHGNEKVQVDYRKYIEDLPNKVKGSLKILTPKMLGHFATVSDLRNFIEKEKLDMLVIDQHSLMEDERKAKSPVEKAANISIDLKHLQVIEKIPIIAVAQMNRTKSEDDSGLIDPTQIAQTDRIGQDATIIVGLSRDKKDETLLRVQLVKSRDTSKGQLLKYKADFDKGIFIYIPEEEKDEPNNDLPTNTYDEEEIF